MAELKKNDAVSHRLPVRPDYEANTVTALQLCADEMWSFMGSKKQPRWLWWVEETPTGRVLAFAFGWRTHATFRRLRQLLARLGQQWRTGSPTPGGSEVV